MIRATAVIAAAIVGMAFAVGMSSIDMANAEDDKHWYFDVENDSNGTVNELRTQEHGEWSENWLSNRIEPGDKIKLDFETDEGKCEVRTQDPSDRWQLLRCAGRLLQGQDAHHSRQHLALEVNSALRRARPNTRAAAGSPQR